MMPAFGVPMLAFGFAKLGWFRIFVASKRICRFATSLRRLIAKFLPIEKSTSTSFGPRRMFLPSLPNVNADGCANAPVLNHCPIVGFDRYGLPTTFGYQVPDRAPVR